MAQETLKITITADNKEAITNINQTITSTNTLGNSLSKLPQASGAATQSLVNLSRVAQDAPYGFIGIANNLNPLLESFQRLSEQSKKAGSSLTKELGAALVGPAGIGLALGVASSLLIKFGDDISDFITNKLTGLGDAFNRENQLLEKGSESYVKASTDITKLKDSFDDYQNGLVTKDKFLKEFNSTLGDTIAKTNDLATAEKFLTSYSDTYVQMTFKKSVANLAAAESAKKQIELELLKNKPITPDTGTFLSAIFGNPALIGVKAAESKLALQNGLSDQVGVFDSIRKKYTDESNKLQATLTNAFGAADISRPDKKPKVSKLKFEDISLYDADIEKQIREENKKLGLYQEGYENILGETFGKKDKPQSKLSFQGGMDEMDKFFEDNKKNFDDINERALRFADTVSNTITNSIMGMWSALEQGAPFLESLGNMFLDLAKQIAAAAIKAAVFASILNIVFPGIGGAASAGGFSGIFKGLLGLAEGGVVTGPTLAMVGEGNESEAVMPLSKLGNLMQSTFNAGSMASNGGGGNGEFVLRGQDLVLAMNRSETSLKYRRG
jgi:hypothetical protein